MSRFHHCSIDRGLRIAVAAGLIVFAICLQLACTDFEAPKAPVTADSLVAVPSFSRDIQPLLSAHCATAGCHTAVTHQLGLILDAEHAYDELVGQRSLFYPGIFLVVPSRSDSSWVVDLIGADSLRRFGHPRMPLGRAPLTDRQIQTIVNWIDQGAKEN